MRNKKLMEFLITWLNMYTDIRCTKKTILLFKESSLSIESDFSIVVNNLSIHNDNKMYALPSEITEEVLPTYYKIV